MHIETVPNRNSRPTVLLRESYRKDGKVKKRTLANLTHLPAHVVEGMRQLLRGGRVVESIEESFDTMRSLPHGHVAAVLGTLRNLGLDRIIGDCHSREHALALALIVARMASSEQNSLAMAASLPNGLPFWESHAAWYIRCRPASISVAMSDS